jgi:hypothetical protein
LICPTNPVYDFIPKILNGLLFVSFVIIVAWNYRYYARKEQAGRFSRNGTPRGVVRSKYGKKGGTYGTKNNPQKE